MPAAYPLFPKASSRYFSTEKLRRFWMLEDYAPDCKDFSHSPPYVEYGFEFLSNVSMVTFVGSAVHSKM